MTNVLFRDFHFAVTVALVTMIWIVQILHYPSFLYYDKASFPEAMLFHQRRISFIVVPLMIIELVLSMYVFAVDMNLNHLMSLICVIIVWASTFFIQVPLHSKLSTFNESLINNLVKGNVIRTLAWTLKLLVMELDRI